MAVEKKTTKKAPAKKAADVKPVKAASAKPAVAKPAAKKAPAKKTVAKKSTVKPAVSQEQFYSMVSEAAYFAAQNDNNRKGSVEYWMDAEEAIRAKFNVA